MLTTEQEKCREMERMEESRAASSYRSSYNSSGGGQSSRQTSTRIYSKSGGSSYKYGNVDGEAEEL